MFWQKDGLEKLFIAAFFFALPISGAVKSLNRLWPLPNHYWENIGDAAGLAVVVILYLWKLRGRTVPDYILAAYRRLMEFLFPKERMERMGNAFMVLAWAVCVLVSVLKFQQHHWRAFGITFTVAVLGLVAAWGYRREVTWQLTWLLGIPSEPLSEKWKKENRTHIRSEGFTFPAKVGDWVITDNGSRGKISATNGPNVALKHDEDGISWDRRMDVETERAHARRIGRVWKPLVTLALAALLARQIEIIRAVGGVAAPDGSDLTVGYLFGGYLLGVPAMLGLIFMLSWLLSDLIDEILYARGSQNFKGARVFDPNPADRLNPSGRQPHGDTSAETI